MKLTACLGAFVSVLSFHAAQAQAQFWTPNDNILAAEDVRSLAAGLSGTVFAGTWTDGAVWKTTNNGGTWVKCAALPMPNPVLALAVRPSGDLFACVYLRGICRSTDNGASWREKDSGLTANTLHGALVDNLGNVWVATESGLFRSTDNGESWTLRRAGYFYNIFLDSTHAVASDDGALLHRSTDQGATWTTTPITNLSFQGVNADRSYFASTLSSGISRSTDFGSTWTDMHSGVSWSGAQWSTAFTSRGDIYYGRNGTQTGIIVSLDSGKTWTVTNGGLTNTAINMLLFVRSGFVYAATGAGIFRSTFSTGNTPAPIIDIEPSLVDFGTVRLGATDSVSVQVLSLGFPDSLRISSITSTNPRFTATAGPMVLPPHSVRTMTVVYAPAAAGSDTGRILIASNDPATPVAGLRLKGSGYGLGHAPQIMQLSLVPSDPGLAHLVWFRSSDDTAGAADPVIQYSIWRSGPTPGASGPAASRPQGFESVGSTWDFIALVPAIGLDEYGYTVPVPNAYVQPAPWYVLMVAAQTRSLKVYQSVPDSIQDPLATTGIGNANPSGAPGDVVLRQNYPNPFNPSTTIRYGVPRTSAVTLTVYNTLGQRVAVLVDDVRHAGFYDVRFDGTALASGTYFCLLRAGDVVRTQRLLLLR